MYNWKFLLQQLAGENSHHIIEATFKAFARALRQATENDPRRGGTIPRFDLSSTTFCYTHLDRINIIDYVRFITSYKHILFVILRIFFLSWGEVTVRKRVWMWLICFWEYAVQKEYCHGPESWAIRRKTPRFTLYYRVHHELESKLGEDHSLYQMASNLYN